MATLPLPSTINPALLLENDDQPSSSTIRRVLVHPVVLLHVLDHHTRRQEAGGRVIGTLLGRVVDDKGSAGQSSSTIEITNCFAVPHAERGDEVAIGKDFNKQMLALHTRANRKEVVVGWYATAAENMPLLADTSSLIHEFYAGETEDGDPVHLVFDTRLVEDRLQIRAYKSTAVVVQGEPMGNLFHELELELQSGPAETICLSEMIQQQDKDYEEKKEPAKDDEKDDDATKLQVSMEKLQQLLGETLSYVDKVVDGSMEADPQVGRQIADTLAIVPRIESFDKLFHDSLQDLLMVSYLSNITRTQLTLAEKLNASLGTV